MQLTLTVGSYAVPKVSKSLHTQTYAEILTTVLLQGLGYQTSRVERPDDGIQARQTPGGSVGDSGAQNRAVLNDPSGGQGVGRAAVQGSPDRAVLSLDGEADARLAEFHAAPQRQLAAAHHAAPEVRAGGRGVPVRAAGETHSALFDRTEWH